MRNPLRTAIDRVEQANPFLLAHHPSCEYYDHHTITVYGADLCLGCFVVYPVGALALATLTVVRMAVPAAFAVETYVFYGVGAGLVAPKVLSTLAAGRHRRWVRIATKASLACGIAVVALPLLFRPADRLPTAGLVAGFLVAYVGYKGRTALDDCEGCPEAATFPNCSGMDLADRGDGEEHG